MQTHLRATPWQRMIQAGRFVCQNNRPAILFLSSIDIIKNMPTNNKKKKILYVITKSNWGGAQNYVHSLATNLSENYETVVAHGGDGLMCKKLDQSKIKRIRIKTLDRDVKIWNELKVLKKLIGIFKEEGPDIVHLNSSKIGGLGALAGRIAGIEKIIFTAHGFAFNEDRGYLENLIKQEGLENNVYLTGFIDDAKKYLKAFDIFLMSSVKEGFPYALLEAGLAGNAIICTDVGGTSEIVDNLESGILIRPKNKKEIMNALRLYMEDEDKIVEYGDRIKQKVLKEFSVEKMVEETLRIY